MTQETSKSVEPSIGQKQVPPKFEEYVKEKVKQQGKGGRPHLLSVLGGKGRDPDEKDPEKALDKMCKYAKEELLNICEQAILKGRSLRLIAKDYDTEYLNVYRTLKDLFSLSPTLKQEIADYIRNVPRRKRWYIQELDTSDYENIQNYIRRAKRDGLRRYKDLIHRARKVWVALNCRDPQYWTADEVCQYLATLTPGAQSTVLDAIRQIAPQIAIKGSTNQVQTGRFREKLGRRKKDLFGNEINMIRDALHKHFELLAKFDLHITLGAREGAADPHSGLTGLTWDRFKNDFTKADLYESKVRGGITWRDCPLDLFFKDLPARLRSLWTRRGKPTSDRVFLDGYKEVRETYKQIREILAKEYTGNVDPSLLKEFITLKPHDADKIHVNLLWEAEIPLEVVGGQFVGKSEGIGMMGRGWLDINVIKKHYLSLTGRSERMKKLQNQVRQYSERFERNTTLQITTKTEENSTVETGEVCG